MDILTNPRQACGPRPVGNSGLLSALREEKGQTKGKIQKQKLSEAML